MTIEKYLEQELKFLEAEQIAKKERAKLEKIRANLSEADRKLTDFYCYYSSIFSIRLDCLTPKQQVNVHKMMLKLLQGDEGVLKGENVYEKVSGNLILLYRRNPFRVIDIWTKNSLKKWREQNKNFLKG